MDEIGSDVIIIQPNEVVKEQESIHKSESLGVVVAEKEDKGRPAIQSFREIPTFLMSYEL